MADLVDRIRKELDARIEQLRPLVGEFERLQRAAAALGARSRRAGGRAPRRARSARTCRQSRGRNAGRAHAFARASR
jgi:hypothetical protein